MKHQSMLSCEVQECTSLDVYKNRSDEDVRSEISVIFVRSNTAMILPSVGDI